MGAWIEIIPFVLPSTALSSLPAWGRGLKYNNLFHDHIDKYVVAPRMGAWIEMMTYSSKNIFVTCRSPHGGVD